MKVTYTKAQRDRAKADGLKLCGIDTPQLSFGGPCTHEEYRLFVRFADLILKKRAARLKAQREATQSN